MYCNLCKQDLDLDNFELVGIEIASYGKILTLKCDFCNTDIKYVELYNFANKPIFKGGASL